MTAQIERDPRHGVELSGPSRAQRDYDARMLDTGPRLNRPVRVYADFVWRGGKAVPDDAGIAVCPADYLNDPIGGR